ncbi:MAG: Asp23/Gls24 family envelope stress response protein [Candidatus Omnitrophica bacterium]|nr:Asp23/Gls24 family envelope stress response protein [Candidatus Omnitrophota bacterium]
MTQTDERRTDYGLIKIHKNVIAQVASLAAKDTEGVNRISGNLITKALRFLTKGKFAPYPIRVDFKGNNEVSVCVGIVVNYGVNIPAVALNVQENIKRVVEKTTGLSAADVHIKVKGVEIK